MVNCENCKYFELEGIEAVCAKKCIVLDGSINFAKKCKDKETNKEFKRRIKKILELCNDTDTIVQDYETPYELAEDIKSICTTGKDRNENERI